MRVAKQKKRGMTLVEVLLTVSVIGMLAMLLIPAVNLAIRSRESSRCASQLRSAAAVFEMFRAETGSYPPDQVVPGETTVAGMSDYFADAGIDWWGDTTPLGGRWDWDIGFHGFAASISIWKPTVPEKQLLEYDRLVDDGNLGTGNLRLVSGQYHYILKE